MTNNFLITRQFAVVVALMWLAFLAQATLSYSGMAAGRSSLKTVHDLYMAQMEDLALMKQNISANRLELLLAFQHDPQGPLFSIHDHAVGVHQDRLAKRRKANDEAWARVQARCAAAGTQSLCAGVDAQRAAWVARVDQTQQKINAQDFTAPTMAAFLKAGREEGEALLGALDTLLKHQQTAANEATLAAEARHSQTLWAAMLLALCLGVPALVLTENLRRRLHGGFAAADKMARTIAEGDLTRAPNIRGTDEIARLLSHMDDMRRALARVISQVRLSADNILTASSEVAAGNMDLSDRTEKTAGNLQQTASASEQLGSTVQRNADSAHQADTLAQDASRIAARGGEEVAEVVTTMREIDQSAKQIAEITGVINGIAFQTNILALNAAVEAARAGEQGRGFAVVAAEVRTLAQRSAAAAKQISTLIESSVEHVAQGTRVADRAGTTMHSVVSAIGRVSGLVGEISQASSEQSSGVSLVVQAVQHMDSATQQNAALVEEGAAAASSLSEQAGQLVQAVSVFKLSPG